MVCDGEVVSCSFFWMFLIAFGVSGAGRLARPTLRPTFVYRSRLPMTLVIARHRSARGPTLAGNAVLPIM